MNKCIFRIYSILYLHFFSMHAYTQEAISVVNIDSIGISLNQKCYGIAIKGNIARPIDSIWNDFNNHKFSPLDNVLNIPYFKIGDYDIWTAFLLKNELTATIPIFIKAMHEPLAVFRINKNNKVNLKFLGHAAEYDFYNLLKVKERNGFTVNIDPFTTDTIFMRFKVIEAGESRTLNLFNAAKFNDLRLSEFQVSTLFNSILLGILVMLLLGTFYFFKKIKERFLIWYMCYLIIFILYYWRDLEFWNTQFDVTHRYLSWFATKTPITLFIFLFYLLFINSILKYQKEDQFNSFIKYLKFIIPALCILDVILLQVYPIGSIVLAYGSGFVMGIIQMMFLYPIWKNKRRDSTIQYLLLGSVSLFGGWLTILFLPESIHQYTVRMFTLLELAFFMLAITERFLKVKIETLEFQLQGEKLITVERERIDQELNHEIGNTLKDVLFQADLAHEAIITSRKTSSISSLDHITEKAGDMINRLSDIIWCLNPKYDKLDSLIQRLGDPLHWIDKNQPFPPIVSNNTLDTQIILQIPVRRSIYFLCKDILSIIKNGETSNGEIVFNYESPYLRIDINKKGKDLDEPSYPVLIKLNNLISKEIYTGLQSFEIIEQLEDIKVSLQFIIDIE